MSVIERVTPMPDRISPRGRVATEVRAEMGRCKVNTNHLPRLLGKSQSYWSRRVNGDVPFDVDELYALARLLKVPITQFLVTVECAARDSNPEPAD